MIQFNLLPDIKKEYIKARKQKQMIISASFLVSAVAVGLTVLLFIYVQFIQKQYINDLSDDIDSSIQELRSIPDLDKILTVQQQAGSLDGLHEEVPYTSRIFEIMASFTPETIKYSGIQIDTVGKTITFDATSTNLVEINRFVDTVRFAEFEATPIDQNEESTDEIITGDAFTIVSSEIGRSEDSSGVTMTIGYDENMFNNKLNFKIIVPNQKITTQSETESPDINLFNETLQEPTDEN